MQNSNEITILIVDDSPEDRETIKHFLSKSGGVTYRYLEAETGEKGLELSKSHKPDCILLDFKLPDTDGICFIKDMVYEHNLGDIPVILLTGQGDETVATESLKSGAQDYLIKGNLNSGSLMRSIRYATEKKQAEITLRESEAKYRQIYGTTFDGIITASKESKIIETDLKEPFTEFGQIAEHYNSVIDALQKATAKTDASLKEKEVLLKEIHHRVKNNMQVISSLLSLQSRYSKDERYIEMVKESQIRIKAIALIHEKLYCSKDLASIDFNDYIRSLVNDLFLSYKANTNKIELNVNIENVSLGIEAAIPCGLIVNELVSNSLKYAFPEGRDGEMRISLRLLDEGQYELIVSDNGIGMPKDIDFKNSGSLGLRLVTNFTERTLHGKIELKKLKGTEFQIIFKEKKYKERM